MGERLTIGFGDPQGALHGVAITGLGTLLAAGEDVRSAGEPRVRALSGVTHIDGDGFEVALEPIGGPGRLGTTGEVWLCRAHGALAGEPFDALGTITRAAAAAVVPLERALSAWFTPELGVALVAQRARGAGGHGDERLAALIFRGEAPAANPIGDPRLSTTYDGDGHVTHCGLELWESEESEVAERIGGESFAQGELAGPDGARTRVAFMAFHRDGASGAGYYALTTTA